MSGTGFRRLTDVERANFETLLQAAGNGDLALLQTRENATGNAVALVCAVNRSAEAYFMLPIAVMIEGDPFELYADPAEGLADEPAEATP